MEDKRQKLTYKPATVYSRMKDGEWDEVCAYAEGYKKFLDAGKTERECVAEVLRQAEGKDLYTYTRHNKAVILIKKGKRPVSDGLRIVAAHIDSPRIDLKPYPLYEKDGFALFKTHYYGGIKKYHWMATPLVLRGIVYLKDGSSVTFAGGDSEPCLFITDVPPHLGEDQAKKVLKEAFPGENLNVTVGNVPDNECEKDGEKIKLAVLSLLNKRYGITEHDFQSAELCLVPAANAQDAGLDGSMIGAYGHDDRSCSYAAMKALFDTTDPEYTCVCILADKEEIGSEGITGMRSAFFDTVIEELCEGASLKSCYMNSFCYSGDVTNAFDPNFADVSDPLNNARMGRGPCVIKATGRGGKSGASDASAETVSKTRLLLDKAGVCWQMGELGKVDQGGGGTVAAYLARRNIEVVDIGVPVLNMHAPMEVVSKADCWETYRAFKALYGSVD